MPRRRSGRTRRAPWSQVASKLPGYWAAPSYGKCHIDWGGTGVQAVLGPGPLSGTAADSKLPQAIVAAREKYPGAKFKAGHILNQDFGGIGNAVENLTILSASGNSSHRRFDNNVKYAREFLLKLYQEMHEADVNLAEVQLGIAISIEVSSTRCGWMEPDCYICTHLYCGAGVAGAVPPEFEGSNNYRRLVHYVAKAAGNGTISNWSF